MWVIPTPNADRCLGTFIIGPIIITSCLISNFFFREQVHIIENKQLRKCANQTCIVKINIFIYNSKTLFFADVPNVEISTTQEVYFGSKISFTSRIVSCPSPDGAEWQQSNDGNTFKSIIISKPKYYGSSCDPKSPLLIIPKVTFEDKLYYRLLVGNKIGEQYSNTVFLDVKGSTQYMN